MYGKQHADREVKMCMLLSRYKPIQKKLQLLAEPQGQYLVPDAYTHVPGTHSGSLAIAERTTPETYTRHLALSTLAPSRCLAAGIARPPYAAPPVKRHLDTSRPRHLEGLVTSRPRDRDTSRAW